MKKWVSKCLIVIFLFIVLSTTLVGCTKTIAENEVQKIIRNAFLELDEAIDLQVTTDSRTVGEEIITYKTVYAKQGYGYKKILTFSRYLEIQGSGNPNKITTDYKTYIGQVEYNTYYMMVNLQEKHFNDGLENTDRRKTEKKYLSLINYETFASTINDIGSEIENDILLGAKDATYDFFTSYEGKKTKKSGKEIFVVKMKYVDSEKDEDGNVIDYYREVEITITDGKIQKIYAESEKSVNGEKTNEYEERTEIFVYDFEKQIMPDTTGYTEVSP